VLRGWSNNQICGNLSCNLEVTRSNAGTLELCVTTTSYFVLAEKSRLKRKYDIADGYINRSSTNLSSLKGSFSLRERILISPNIGMRRGLRHVCNMEGMSSCGVGPRVRWWNVSGRFLVSWPSSSFCVTNGGATQYRPTAVTKLSCRTALRLTFLLRVSYKENK
jgi:hypothetical protein